MRKDCQYCLPSGICTKISGAKRRDDEAYYCDVQDARSCALFKKRVRPNYFTLPLTLPLTLPYDLFKKRVDKKHEQSKQRC